MRLQAVGALCIAGTLLASFSATAVAQESPSFKVERITVTVGGEPTESTSFGSDVVAGQTSPSGTASFCNAGHASSLGFFSVLGGFNVPIRLHLGKNAADPDIVELDWTGNATVFQLYSSSSPHDVTNPTNLDLETSLCEGPDTSGSADVVFFKVIAAPGQRPAHARGEVQGGDSR